MDCAPTSCSGSTAAPSATEFECCCWRACQMGCLTRPLRAPSPRALTPQRYTSDPATECCSGTATTTPGLCDAVADKF